MLFWCKYLTNVFLSICLIGISCVEVLAADRYSPNHDIDTVSIGDEIHYAVGGWGVGSANGGTVVLDTGGSYDVTGGFIFTSDTNPVTAMNNSVSMVGGMVDSLAGATIVSIGTSNASNNSVFVNMGTVNNGIYGGQASSLSGNAMANNNVIYFSGGSILDSSGLSMVAGGSATANNEAWAVGNTIIISGGTIDTDIAGGFAGSFASSAIASDNKIILLGNPQLNDSNLYGGVANSLSGIGYSYNNTLEVHTKNLTLSNIGFFQNLYFYLPVDIQANDTVLMLTDTGNDTDISKAQIGVTIDSLEHDLKIGDRVVLIENVHGMLVSNDITQTSIQGQQGSTIAYDFLLTADNRYLIATLQGISASKASKALSEGYLGGMILDLQGADLVAGQGMESLTTSIYEAGKYALTSFATVSAGVMRYDTGSHIDMKSYSMLAGFGYGVDLGEKHTLSLGGFFEYGNGSYDTYHSFDNDGIRAEGDSYYLGFGLLGHLDFAPVQLAEKTGNFYLEASARMGRMYNDFFSDDLMNYFGQRAEYDSHIPYFSLHTGLGFDWQLSEKASLDLYGKYFWTHLQGDNLILSTGENLDFKAVNSHRVRLGGRVNYVYDEKICPYFGLAYEYEFDGTMSATTNGYAIGALNREPELQGSTGIAEMGLSFAMAGDLSLDFSVQAYVGQREGITGSAMLSYAF